MEHSKKAWVALALGTGATVLSMCIGLSLLQRVRGEHTDSEEYLWITANGDALGLPLAQSKLFTSYLKGYEGGGSPHAEEFQRILHDARAEEMFADLAQVGPEGARLYGLCGLKALRSMQLTHYMSLAAADERRVALINGCSLYVQRVHEAIQNPRVWAVCEKLSAASLPNRALQSDDPARRR